MGFDDLFDRAEAGPEAAVVVVGVDTFDSELVRRRLLADLEPGAMIWSQSITFFIKWLFVDLRYRGYCASSARVTTCG